MALSGRKRGGRQWRVVAVRGLLLSFPCVAVEKMLSVLFFFVGCWTLRESCQLFIFFFFFSLSPLSFSLLNESKKILCL